MYNETQEWLKQWGVTHIPLYRGVSLPKDEFDAIAEWGGTIAFDDNALSSWSLSSSVAQDFADTYASREERKTGVVLSALVPIERILSTPFTGLGCLEEREFVVIGSNEPAYARVYDIGGSPYKAFPFKGGPGSGNFDHAGRPGEVGGSAPSGTAAAQSDHATEVPTFKTTKAAVAWLKQQYPGVKWEIGEVALPHAQEIAGVFHRMVSDYSLELVGSLGKVDVVSMEHDSWVMASGTLPGGEKVISLNAAYFGSDSYLSVEDAIAESIECGWWHESSDVGFTFAHEVGHAISSWMRARTIRNAEQDWVWYEAGDQKGRLLTLSDLYQWWQYANPMQKNLKYRPDVPREPDISDYSKIDPEERFAEAVGWLGVHPPGTEPPNTYVKNVKGLLGWLKSAKLSPVPLERERSTGKRVSPASVSAMNQAFADMGIDLRFDKGGQRIRQNRGAS